MAPVTIERIEVERGTVHFSAQCKGASGSLITGLWGMEIDAANIIETIVVKNA